MASEREFEGLLAEAGAAEADANHAYAEYLAARAEWTAQKNRSLRALSALSEAARGAGLARKDWMMRWYAACDAARAAQLRERDDG